MGKCLANIIQLLKREFLAIKSKKLTPKFTYHNNQVPLKAVQHAKYLGMAIGSKLMRKEHTYQDNHKASTALVFLCCNLKPYSLYIKTKYLLETVGPIIEYDCSYSLGISYCSRYQQN